MSAPARPIESSGEWSPRGDHRRPSSWRLQYPASLVPIQAACLRTGHAPYHGGVTWSGTPDATGARIAVAQLHGGGHALRIVRRPDRGDAAASRPGVAAASVDLDSARAVVEYDPSAIDVEAAPCRRRRGRVLRRLPAG